MKHSKTGIYGVLVVALMALATVSSQGQTPELENTLVTLGYRIRQYVDVAPTDWEKGELHMREKRRYMVKSAKSVPGVRNLYYRFIVDLETYGDAVVAQHRLERIKTVPPGVDAKTRPEYTLREGFRRGNLVYVVSTDVYRFVIENALTRLREQLEESIVDFGDPLGCCGPIRTAKIEGKCKRAVAGKKRYLSYFLTFDVLAVLEGAFKAKEVTIEAIPTPWAVKPNIDAAKLIETLRIEQVEKAVVCDSNVPVMLTLDTELGDRTAVTKVKLKGFAAK